MIRIVSRMTGFHSPSTEELIEEEEKVGELVEKETPSLDKGLVNLEEKFTEEEERRRDIESKAAGVLTVSSVLVALLQFFGQEFIGGGARILLAYSLLLSALLSLANLVPVGYMTPQLDSILTYSFEEEDEYTKRLYKKYHLMIFNNRKVNESRLRLLRWSYYPIVVFVLVLAGTLITVPSC